MTDENGTNDSATEGAGIDASRLLQAAAQLSTDIKPQNDLWPGIAVAIATPAPRRWAPMFAQAAAVVLLVGGSSAVTYLAMEDRATAGPTIANPDMIFEQAAFGNRYQLGHGFQDARNALVDELDAELLRMSPQARADIETNLQLIQDAIAEMNKALEQEPDNTLLQERLLRTYREELLLLRRVSGLSQNVMLRNDF